MASFPRPYLNTVPTKPGSDPMIETVPFDSMGIGANSVGMPKGSINSDCMSIEHVGGSKGGK
jgi:hypothetical protein